MTNKDLHRYFEYIRAIVRSSTMTNEHGVRDGFNSIELNAGRYNIKRISDIVRQIYLFVRWQQKKITSLNKSIKQSMDIKQAISTKFNNIGLHDFVANVDKTAGRVCAELLQLRAKNASLTAELDATQREFAELNAKLNSAQQTITNAKTLLEAETCDSSHTQGLKRPRT